MGYCLCLCKLIIKLFLIHECWTVFKWVSSRSLIECVTSPQINCRGHFLFFLCYSLMCHENPLDIFPYGAPSFALGKLDKLTSVPSGKSNPFCVGGMNIFWNHTFFLESYLWFPEQDFYFGCVPLSQFKSRFCYRVFSFLFHWRPNL